MTQPTIPPISSWPRRRPPTTTSRKLVFATIDLGRNNTLRSFSSTTHAATVERTTHRRVLGESSWVAAFAAMTESGARLSVLPRQILRFEGEPTMPWYMWLLLTVMLGSVAFKFVDGFSTNPQTFGLLCLIAAAFLYLQNPIEKLEEANVDAERRTAELLKRIKYIEELSE